MATRQLGKTHAIGLDEPYTRLLSSFYELSHSGIAPGGFKVDFNDGLRRCF
jgi:hypothetical protein